MSRALGKYGRAIKSNSGVRPPSRSMREIALSYSKPIEPGRSLRVFNVRGFSAHHSPIGTPDSFDYHWVGRSHYLALHDLRLQDGETFCDEAVSVRARDLRGLITFIPAGCRIWGWSRPASGRHSFTALYLDPRQAEEELSQRLHSVPLQPHVYFADPALRSTLGKIQAALTSAAGYDTLYLESLCLISAVELCGFQNEKLQSGTRRNGRLTPTTEKQIVDYVDANLSAEIGLGDLAGLARLSRFHFIRAFKKTTQETPYKYVLRRRIERAESLLRSSSMSVGEVAVAVGFKDAARFIRTFRKITGATPGAFARVVSK